MEDVVADILVVDDDRIQLRIASYTLRKQGHMVVVANDGVTALKLLRDTAFDLVVTDLSMPLMDGLTLLREIRADHRYRHLPVIVLTGSILEQQDLSARNEGANAFLTKPTRSDDLIATVNRLLRS